MRSSPTSTGGTTPDASNANWPTSAPTNTSPPGTPPKPNNPRQLSLHLRQPAPGNQPSEKTGGTQMTVRSSRVADSRHGANPGVSRRFARPDGQDQTPVFAVLAGHSDRQRRPSDSRQMRMCVRPSLTYAARG